MDHWNAANSFSQTNHELASYHIDEAINCINQCLNSAVHPAFKVYVYRLNVIMLMRKYHIQYEDMQQHSDSAKNNEKDKLVMLDISIYLAQVVDRIKRDEKLKDYFKYFDENSRYLTEYSQDEAQTKVSSEFKKAQSSYMAVQVLIEFMSLLYVELNRQRHELLSCILQGKLDMVKKDSKFTDKIEWLLDFENKEDVPFMPNFPNQCENLWWMYEKEGELKCHETLDSFVSIRDTRHPDVWFNQWNQILYWYNSDTKNPDWIDWGEPSLMHKTEEIPTHIEYHGREAVRLRNKHDKTNMSNYQRLHQIIEMQSGTVQDVFDKNWIAQIYQNGIYSKLPKHPFTAYFSKEKHFYHQPFAKCDTLDAFMYKPNLVPQHIATVISSPWTNVQNLILTGIEGDRDLSLLLLATRMRTSTSPIKSLTLLAVDKTGFKCDNLISLLGHLTRRDSKLILDTLVVSGSFGDKSWKYMESLVSKSTSDEIKLPKKIDFATSVIQNEEMFDSVATKLKRTFDCAVTRNDGESSV